MLKDKIRQLRQERGLSGRELSRRMNKNDTAHLSMIESGKRRKLSLMTACELAAAFEISLDELIDGTEYDLREVITIEAREESDKAAEGDT